MALSPKLPVAFCGFLQQFFFKSETKFDADSLLLTFRHVRCKNKTVAGSLKRNLTKTH